jgi:alpha-tubulin suppressor-like RCC1 family protein
VSQAICPASARAHASHAADQGRVFSCGFGALGLGAERLSSATLQQIPALAHERIVTLGAGLEYCAALSASGRLYSWGLNSPSGRLGLGPPLPRPSFALASRFTPDAVELRTYEPLEAQGMRRAWSRVPQHAHIVCGRDALWVLVEDGQEEVGRWAAR